MDELINALRQGITATQDIIEKTPHHAWKEANPNPGWTNQDALNHLVGAVVAFAKGFGASDIDEVKEKSSGRDFEKAATALLTAIAAPGALEQDITLPWATVPAEKALRMAVIEVISHGWDIAQGTDQQVTWDDETADLVFDLSQNMPEGQDGGPFGSPKQAPEGASTMDKAMARLGRTPKP